MHVRFQGRDLRILQGGEVHIGRVPVDEHTKIGLLMFDAPEDTAGALPFTDVIERIEDELSCFAIRGVKVDSLPQRGVGNLGIAHGLGCLPC
jgi:hypothetical protein